MAIMRNIEKMIHDALASTDEVNKRRDALASTDEVNKRPDALTGTDEVNKKKNVSVYRLKDLSTVDDVSTALLVLFSNNLTEY